MSLPSWERGLKSRSNGSICLTDTSLPSWERGLKSRTISYHIFALLVAPLVGAWIEIGRHRLDIVLSIVAPLVGAWIEI